MRQSSDPVIDFLTQKDNLPWAMEVIERSQIICEEAISDFAQAVSANVSEFGNRHNIQIKKWKNTNGYRCFSVDAPPVEHSCVVPAFEVSSAPKDCYAGYGLLWLKNGETVNLASSAKEYSLSEVTALSSSLVRQGFEACGGFWLVWKPLWSDKEVTTFAVDCWRNRNPDVMASEFSDFAIKMVNPLGKVNEALATQKS